MASSGKITAHNLHLLEDDESPAGAEDQGNKSALPDDDLNLRTATAGSNSSADSRKLDESPVDEDPDEPPVSLAEEAKYQQDLKERVKKSFADLGIEAEGVLLKDSLEETPRDSLSISEELPYDANINQGNYDARRKKQRKPGDVDDTDSDREDSEEQNSRNRSPPSPVGDENILADSLDVVDNNSNHKPTQENLEEPSAPSPSDNKPHEPDDEEVNDLRDSLDDLAEPELQDLNESNPPEENTDNFADAESKSGTLSPGEGEVNQPENDTPLKGQDSADPQYPHLSKPLELEGDKNTDNVPGSELNEDVLGDEEAPQSEKESSPTEEQNKENDRRLDDDNFDDDPEDNDQDQENGNESAIDSQSDNGANEDRSVSLTPKREASPEGSVATLTQTNAERSASGVSQRSLPKSREPSRASPMSPVSHLNVNNNANDFNGKPPSGSYSRTSSRQRNQSALGSGTQSPNNQTPVRSRNTSRERDTPSRSRTRSRERDGGSRITSGDRGLPPRSRQSSRQSSRQTSPASRQHSTGRSSAARPRSSSAERSYSRLLQKSQASERRGSQDSTSSRRGSREITIPKYTRKGSSNNEGDHVPNGLVHVRSDVRSESRSRREDEPSSSKSERSLPNTAAEERRGSSKEPEIPQASLRTATGPVSQQLSVPNAQESSTSLPPNDPRNFMTPGQHLEAEANKKFWSDLHQAGVFEQSTKPDNQVEKVQKLSSGEKVRVEYISDDSGDEDLHFVDEKGSPIDQLGRPLYAAETPQTPDAADMRIMYRIKPSPPRQKPSRKSSSNRILSRDVSAADSSRYGSSKYSRNSNGQISAKQASRNPARQLVDRQVSPMEEPIVSEQTSEEGALERTLPSRPLDKEATFVKERPVKSAGLQTDEEDPILMHEAKQPENIKSPVQEAGIQTMEREASMQTSDDRVQSNYDNRPPQESPLQSPRGIPGSGGPFGQVQVQPFQDQNQGFHLQSPPSLPNQFQYPPNAYAHQGPMNYPSNPQGQWQPGYGHPGYLNQSQQFAAPLQPQFINPAYGMNQQMQPQMMQPYPAPQHNQPPPFQHPVHPQYQQMQPGIGQSPFAHPGPPMNGMQYPVQHDPPGGSYSNQLRQQTGQEMEHPDEHSEDYPGQRETKPRSMERRPPPKPKQNFIDLNKTSAKLRRDPPNKRYTEKLQQKTKSPLNPRNPLPQISRENSLDDEQPSSTGWTPHGSATKRSENMWAQQLLHEQQMLQLARGMSDPSIMGQQQRQMGPARHSSDGYPPPDSQPQAVNGQPYSWSADRANTYARMNAQNHAQQSQQDRMRGQPHFDSRENFNDPMTSPRQRMAYTHPMPSRTSPFQVLPDIPLRRSSEDAELRKSDPDGYAVKLQKKNQPPSYRPYTLRDFQNLKKDFKLGGLGPDKTTITERQDKKTRQREYARQVMEQNRKVIHQSPTAGSPSQPRDTPRAEPSKRDLALEYAKKVPKPRIPTPPDVLHDRLYGSKTNSRQSNATEADIDIDHHEKMVEEMARLDELTERHKQEREQLDSMRGRDGK